jgi:hypothetical protein
LPPRVLAEPAGGPPLSISTIGAGREGGALAALFVKAGHRVMFSSRHPDTLKGLVDEFGSQSRAVIEKIEQYRDVGFAVVLLTPDDEGRLIGETFQPRARQNVLVELGYFIGKLSRQRVCTLQVGKIEIPSDWAGVINAPFDAGGAWRQVEKKSRSAG